jgi:hypothetical protein
MIWKHKNMQPSEADVKPRAGISTSPPQSAGLAHWLALSLLFAMAAALRFHCLACKPFWFDEAFSVETARIDWKNFARLLWWREANMSFYYFLLRGWLRFGQSPFFIRALSASISVAVLPVIYCLARSLYNRRVALVATALLALSAFDIRYAQEARSYSLFLLLATLSSGFFIAFLKNPSERNRVGYVCFSVLAVYAHFYALLLIGAQWLTVRWTGIPGDNVDESRACIAKRLRHSWIAISLAVLPLLIFVAKTGAGPIKWIRRPGFAELGEFAAHFSDGMPLVYFAACLLALLPLRKNVPFRRRDWESWRVYFLVIWLLFPILLTVLLSFARPVFLPRYMIFCLPALLILTAAGLTNMRTTWLSALVVGVVLLLSARYVPFVYTHDFDDERDASGAATDFILNHAAPGDGLIFQIADTRAAYEFFRSLRAGENTAGPGFTKPIGPEILFPHHGPGLDYRDFTGKPTADFVRAATTSHARVWLMLMNNGPTGRPDPTTQMLTQLFPESFPTVQRWEFARVEIRLYSRH